MVFYCGAVSELQALSVLLIRYCGHIQKNYIYNCGFTDIMQKTSYIIRTHLINDNHKYYLHNHKVFPLKKKNWLTGQVVHGLLEQVFTIVHKHRTFIYIATNFTIKLPLSARTNIYSIHWLFGLLYLQQSTDCQKYV